ncbi:IS110 family transposase, partial [Vibrio splendidus]
MKTITIGLDIAKNIFHAVHMTSHGKILKKKNLNRTAVLSYFAQIELSCI